MQSPSNFTARVGRWSVRHRKTAIFGWLAFVLVALFIGMNVLPQKEIDQNSGMPGDCEGRLVIDSPVFKVTDDEMDWDASFTAYQTVVGDGPPAEPAPESIR